MQVVFALILAVGTLALPESPRFLISKNKDKIALKNLADMHNKDEDHPDVCKEYDEIKSALDLEAKLGQPTWLEMFTTYRKRSMIGIAVQALGQLAGINIVTVSKETQNFTTTLAHVYMYICIGLLVLCAQNV